MQGFYAVLLLLQSPGGGANVVAAKLILLLQSCCPFQKLQKLKVVALTFTFASANMDLAVATFCSSKTRIVAAATNENTVNYKDTRKFICQSN